MDDFNCPHCEDTGFITVRNTFPCAYVRAGSPPEDARNVCEARCLNCDPVMLVKEYDDEC